MIKWLFIFLLVLTAVSCRYERELFVTEKAWYLQKIDTVYRKGEYQFKLTWINEEGMTVSSFRKSYPAEPIGYLVWWPLIMADWQK